MENVKTRWYKEAIIYQIYPFSFKDSDGDGMGDINGIISKLDYITDLGATAIWFSPLYDSPNKDYGYDIKDYYNMSKAFGTMDDLKKLIDECHKRNIKVIMDSVMNHTSDQHKWFKDVVENPNSEFKDYYIIRKGIKKGQKLLPPNNWVSVFTGSAWEKLPNSEDEFYLHLFTKQQPDLNWENEKVREAVANVFKFYLDLGVDGFRMDVVNVFSKVEGLPNDKAFGVKGQKYYVDGPRMHEFLHDLNRKVLSKYDSMTVGETMNVHKEDAKRYVSEEAEELDTIFDFSHFKSDSIIGAAYLPKKFNLLQFKKGISSPQINQFSSGWNTLVVENHDTPRVVSRFGFDTRNYRYEIATMVPIMLYMQWGTPYIFEGQEIGMTNMDFDDINDFMDPVSHFVHGVMLKYCFPKKLAMKFIKRGARDNCRTPMQWDSSANGGFTSGTPWQKMNDNYPEINVENDLKSEKSIHNFYKEVIKIKKENKVAIYGEYKEYSHKNRAVYAYTRSLGEEHLFVVSNFTNKEVEYVVPDELKRYSLKSILSNYEETEMKDRSIILSPYQATVYSYSDTEKNDEERV